MHGPSDSTSRVVHPIVNATAADAMFAYHIGRRSIRPADSPIGGQMVDYDSAVDRLGATGHAYLSIYHLRHQRVPIPI